MKINICLKAVLLIGTAFLFNEAKAQKGLKTIAFYNVENLFDTINDPKTIDEEFLPDSKLKWTNSIFQQKLKNTAKVISKIDSINGVVLVGLAEIENRFVLNELVKTQFLKKKKYQIIHNESPDERGIDVALLYQKCFYKPLKNEFLKVEVPNDTSFKTREILYTFGLIGKKDTLHIFVNHWPSRRGGQEKSEAYRILAAKTLKEKCHQIFKQNTNAKIIVMGDFNDYPDNKSIYDVLEAKESNSSLINLGYQIHKDGNGSTSYDGKWGLLDQIIVSKGILNNQKLKNNRLNIFKEEWLLFKRKNGDVSPNRSVAGGKFTGGYSDHLPVYIQFLK